MFPNAFSTARLVLRPVAPPDARLIFDSYAQDPEVTRFLTWRPHERIEQTQAYVAICLAASSSRTYVLIEQGSEKIIGALELRQSSPWCVGYGYVLARSSWGQGLMTEALATVADWALGQPGIWRIGDVCDVENLASARVMQKVGFTREGLLARWSVHPNVSGEPRDCFSFSKIKVSSM